MTAIYPIAFLDPPEILTPSVTPIPKASDPPLQVISDLGARAAYAIDYVDSTGDFIGVFTGSVGNETLRCIIGGGVTSRAWTVLAAHSRVSLRSMTPQSITGGNITITFMGY